MIRFLSITRNTFVQTIRQPIYSVVLVISFAALVISVPLAGWTMGTDYHDTDQKMLETLGLSTLLISGLLIAAFSASSALSREIEDRTALTVISKPVSRATFVVGKFAGVSAAVALAYYLGALVYLMTVRHKVMPAAWDEYDVPVIVLGSTAFVVAVAAALLGNYLFGWSFTSTAVFAATVLLSAAMGVISFVGKGWTIVPFGQDIRPELLVGMLLMFLAVHIFVAVAVAASTRLGQTATLLVCCAVLFVGSEHPYLFADTTTVSQRLLSWVVPKLTHFYALDALTMGQGIPASFVAFAAGYSACVIAAALAVGIALFQTRQLEAQGSSSSMPAAVGLLAWLGRIGSVAVAVGGLLLWDFGVVRGPRGPLVAGAMLVAGGLGLAFWHQFGQGKRWAYWIALVLAAAWLLRDLAAVAVPPWQPYLAADGGVVLLTVETVVTAGVVAILLLPKARHHFTSAAA
jgi:ABC-type transport system involved in multi-copper enzyme maturation permease subunit